MIQEGNLSYLGEASRFHQSGEPTSDFDDFGWDEYKVPYEGPPSRFALFKRTWPKNKQHPDFPWLYLIGMSSSHGAMIRSTLTFKGTLNRQHKETTGSDTRLQPLQLKNSSGSRTQAEYYGPVSWWKYIVVGDHPASLAHKGEMHLTDFAYEIFNLRGPGNIRIASGSGSAGTTSIGLPGTNTFTLVPRVVTSRFSCEQVGACWQVTEENEGRLEPPELRPTIGQR